MYHSHCCITETKKIRSPWKRAVCPGHGIANLKLIKKRNPEIKIDETGQELVYFSWAPWIKIWINILMIRKDDKANV